MSFVSVWNQFHKNLNLTHNNFLLSIMFYIRGGQPTASEQFLCGPPDLDLKKNMGALPYVGRNYLPVNIQLNPFFDANLTPRFGM